MPFRGYSRERTTSAATNGSVPQERRWSTPGRTISAVPKSASLSTNSPTASCTIKFSGLMSRWLEVSRVSQLNKLNNSVQIFFRLSWETSTQDNLDLEASDRPETRLELLTRTCSIRFIFHFLISSRIKQGTQLIANPSLLRSCQ